MRLEVVVFRKAGPADFAKPEVVFWWHPNIDIVIPGNKPVVPRRTKKRSPSSPVSQTVFFADADKHSKDIQLVELEIPQRNCHLVTLLRGVYSQSHGHIVFLYGWIEIARKIGAGSVRFDLVF